MPRLTSPREFFSAISESLRLKFSLAWLTFLGLAVPAAALMSVGLPERYVLPALLFLVVPFQYAIFCLLQKRHEPKAKEESRSPEMFPEALALQQIFAPPGQMMGQLSSTFGINLRRVLRGEPDVILAGENRDLEAASAASKLALEEYPVLYTEHARDVPSAIGRLRYMEIESEQRAVWEPTPNLTRTSSVPSLKDEVLQESEESIEIQRQLLERPHTSLLVNHPIPSQPDRMPEPFIGLLSH